MNYIDEKFWQRALEKPNWYVLVADDFQRLEKLAESESDYVRRKRIKGEAYRLVETAVINGTLPYASSGENLDTERKLIDTVVIHHTKNQPGMTLERLNAIQLLRIYGTYYANPKDPREQHLKGKPVWSGHFYNGKQVFWGYHWLIRQDGTAEHILDDNYIGWHAGNWDINTRSVGICIDDDLSEKAPSQTVINAIAGLLRTNYSHVFSNHILGHRDANPKTVCPGSKFHETWRHEILQKVA